MNLQLVGGARHGAAIFSLADELYFYWLKMSHCSVISSYFVGVEPELLSQEVRSEHHHGDAGHGASSETHSESSHEHSEGEDQHEH
ncbi:hypothetical protein [Gimesia chilikensis]|uniref:Uncharacterized protein n=1 Tax=Gimesia chilikensis TaxID=2605989 RepID=A0A517WAW5_9PLAN|nr:hypothetical protein [Gimesia chilikensis]QDT20292.1 hypothetical protein HG66A1_20770 [Gimesia chilikensis]QDU02388.1 hypothetical protein V6x_20910 [Gimesia chilikensis]